MGSERLKIGITGSIKYNSKRTIKDIIFKLSQKFSKDDILIYGLAKKEGPDVWIKKFTLDFGLDYKEFNPVYENHNLYSVLPARMYGKKYTFGRTLHRNKMWADACEKFILFDSKVDTHPEWLDVKKQVNKQLQTTNKKAKTYVI